MPAASVYSAHCRPLAAGCGNDEPLLFNSQLKLGSYFSFYCIKIRPFWVGQDLDARLGPNFKALIVTFPRRDGAEVSSALMGRGI